MFRDDKTYIENKYHKTNEPFNPYRRRAYHGYDYDPATGEDDGEIRRGLLALREKIQDMPHPVAKAYAVKYVLEHTRIDVNEHDFYVGFYSVDRLAQGITQDVWYREIFDGVLPDVSAAMRRFEKAGAIAMWPDFDHVVPDWDALMRYGFRGILGRSEEYRNRLRGEGRLSDGQDAFFEGIRVEYGAILDMLDRMYRYACTKKHEKAPRIATCLRHLRDGAPQDFYDATQLIYIYFMISECFDFYQVRSLGNGLDGTLYPFYCHDLDTGRYTREEIREFLRYFLFQWSAIGNYWGQPFYMGGTDENGGTLYNELSYDILDVYEETGIYNPKIQLKVQENTPDRLLFRVFDRIRKGQNCFVFCCEPGMMRAVMSYGATADEARTMDIRGCYETGVRGNEVSAVSGYVNALKAVEYIFTGGYEPRTGEQIGLPVALADLRTFDDFYRAVLGQWEHLIETTIDCSLQFERYFAYINPSCLYSATIEYAIAQGKDAYQDGVKFSNSSVLNCGMASLVDAVMAVKEFVYEKQVITLAGLGEALRCNWEGYEDLHAQIRKSTHKYGNDDPETDRYAQAMAAYFSMKVNNRPNARGGVYKAVMHSAMEFVWQGKATGATPDGRYAGEEISKNASPSVGMDRSGVTALIHSALRMNPYTYPESFCLDIMLHPSAVEGEEGLLAMKALLMTYLRGGGMSLQCNVFHTETLRDAKEHPEKYRNLQVRVCGWNVLWNNLSPAEQDAYIRRSENLGE